VAFFFFFSELGPEHNVCWGFCHTPSSQMSFWTTELLGGQMSFWTTSHCQC
jgi:hypothetical protein